MSTFLQLASTIVALATPPGKGGVAIVRLSGSLASDIAAKIVKKKPTPRYAEYLPFYDKDDQIIDLGLALYFEGPRSFTGEDVLELHCHGGMYVVDMLIKAAISHGAVPAQPGEFTCRAFLNNKIDLAQAEAISDLINASSYQAAKCATQSLQGGFSNTINETLEQLTALRVYVEASLDFPEEEIDFLSEGAVEQKIASLLNTTCEVKKSAAQGVLLQEGMTLVLSGKPNVGKSSLMNALSERSLAIVTDIPGTTRDTLRHSINIDGLPVEVIDTAGLRESQDVVEQQGMQRAKDAIASADSVLYVTEVQAPSDPNELFDDVALKVDTSKLIVVVNKIDQTNDAPEIFCREDGVTVVKLSAKTGEGLALLRDVLKKKMGYASTEVGGFIARRRHLTSLDKVENALTQALAHLRDTASGELVADCLLVAQNALGEVTGEFTSDDLLGDIFSSFCIGK